MNTLTKRILLTVLGIPIFFSSILFFPQSHYAVFIFIVIIFSILGSYEMHRMIQTSSNKRPLIHPIVAGLLPISAYLQLYYVSFPNLLELVYITVILYTMLHEIFSGNHDNFEGSITQIALSLFHLVYPSLFCVYVIYLSSLENSHIFLILWFLLIFSNDVFAYVFGMLFGKKSRGLFAVSPNKSLVGYIGGFCMTILIGILFYLFVSPIQQYGSLPLFAFLAAIISLGANAGDLVESVLKRSSQKKDSGTIIPGRGGVLDTVDSILFCAPFYYYFIIYLLKV